MARYVGNPGSGYTTVSPGLTSASVGKQARFRARTDHNLVRAHGDASRLGDVRRDGLAQRRAVGGGVLGLAPADGVHARFDDVLGRGKPGLADLQVDDIASLAFQRGGLGQHRVRALVLQGRDPIARVGRITARRPDGARRGATRGATRDARDTPEPRRGTRERRTLPRPCLRDARSDDDDDAFVKKRRRVFFTRLARRVFVRSSRSRASDGTRYLTLYPRVA